MLTEVQKDGVRGQVNAHTLKAEEALAHSYLGRFCPLLDRECEGPRCMMFMQMAMDPHQPGKVTGGACSIPLVASQVGPLAGALEATATNIERLLQSTASKVQVAGSGFVKP